MIFSFFAPGTGLRLIIPRNACWVNMPVKWYFQISLANQLPQINNKLPKRKFSDKMIIPSKIHLLEFLFKVKCKSLPDSEILNKEETHLVLLTITYKIVDYNGIVIQERDQ